MHGPWETVAENIGTIIGYMAVGAMAFFSHAFKGWLDRRKARVSMSASVTRNVQLAAFLAEMRVQADCDRVTLHQFHNGEHFASGASIQKVTMTHFQCRPGVSAPMAPDTVPATLLIGTLDELFKHRYVVTFDMAARDHHLVRDQTLHGLRTVVTALVPGARAGEAFGLLSFAWLDRVAVDTPRLDSLLHFAHQTSAYL